jgi:hypothetical protein
VTLNFTNVGESESFSTFIHCSASVNCFILQILQMLENQKVFRLLFTAVPV